MVIENSLFARNEISLGYQSFKPPVKKQHLHLPYASYGMFSRPLSSFRIIMIPFSLIYSCNLGK